ncbi:putative acetyltransferase [Actinoallomurus rhizosphaericola]
MSLPSIAAVSQRFHHGGRHIGPRFSARYVVSIAPSDIGRRVSLRRRVSSGAYSDVVGELRGWADGRLTVRRRDGSDVEVAEADLVAGKVVPPPPPRRAPRS